MEKQIIIVSEQDDFEKAAKFDNELKEIEVSLSFFDKEVKEIMILFNDYSQQCDVNMQQFYYI